MKILSIIGTRPQYIKIKPLFDYCRANSIDHKILDTNQHYSHNVSDLLIQDLGLQLSNMFDYSDAARMTEIAFMANVMETLEVRVMIEEPDVILVYGDTNSTFCAALVGYKKGIPVGHVEAGLRNFDINLPEEVNRIFVDTVSRWHFCPSVEAMNNLSGGIFSGDLEYEYLNSLNPTINGGKDGIMTVHRQENMSIEKLQHVMELCRRLGSNIRFLVHHRTKPFIDSLDVPQNVILDEPCSYHQMVEYMANSAFMISDSGSIQKTTPFFGLKTLVLRKKVEWVETECHGYTRRYGDIDEDVAWLKEPLDKRDRSFYCDLSNMPSKVICDYVGANE